MRIDIYSAELKNIWNDFVECSKNGTFLFHRDFMDYHSDRFNDLSFFAYKNDKLIALLPGNLSEASYYSHQGLTYGGLITSNETTTLDTIKIFELIISELRNRKIEQIIYKPIPHIYHQKPAEEDLYALFINEAQLVGRGISSTIEFTNDNIQYSSSRIHGLKKAKEAQLYVLETEDFEYFWKILSDNLHKKYNTQPTHSLEEIRLLKSRFPNNIKLYGVYTPNNELVAGEVVFETHKVTHAQYTAATETGKEQGAVDLVIDHIINLASKDKAYFDYGISTENNGLYLNEGLISQKEGFGARGIVYDIYSIKLN